MRHVLQQFHSTMKIHMSIYFNLPLSLSLSLVALLFAVNAFPFWQDTRLFVPRPIGTLAFGRAVLDSGATAARKQLDRLDCVAVLVLGRLRACGTRQVRADVHVLFLFPDGLGNGPTVPGRMTRRGWEGAC